MAGSRRLTGVAHYSGLRKIVIDVPEAGHDRELAFWQGATGQPLARFDRHPEYHGAALHGQEFALLIQRLDDGPARVHLDIHTDDLAAEVRRLEQLGAQRVQQVHGWQIMRDPAGLLFCVLPEPPGTLNDDNAKRWG
jgi:Glyoxalase-like domain